MPSAIDVMVDSLEAARNLIAGYCQDLTPAEMLYRPCPRANCAAWVVGHLTLTDRRVQMMIIKVPPEDLGPLPDGFEARFGQKDGAPQAAEYGDTSGLLPLFQTTRDAFIARLRATDPAAFDVPLPFEHPRFKTMYGAVNFVGGAHTAMHAGQLTIIRRGLGRPPIV